MFDRPTVWIHLVAVAKRASRGFRERDLASGMWLLKSLAKKFKLF